MKFRLGITGGIGSGKSTVCKAFEVLGIPTFYSDTEARYIMDTDAIKQGLISLVGFDIYPEGVLDRARLAELIFNDKELLTSVNKLVHPKVFEAFGRWADKQSSKYVILESAILFESKSDWRADKIIAVIAPVEERVARVMERNHLTRNQVMDRIRNQVSENELIRKSDYMINNSDSSMILSQILEIHNEILNLLNRI